MQNQEKQLMIQMSETEVNTTIAHLEDVVWNMNVEIKNPDDDTEWLSHEITELQGIINKLKYADFHRVVKEIVDAYILTNEEYLETDDLERYKKVQESL